MILEYLAAVLVFSLSIPVVMQYRILPIDGTPYWLFGVLFALLFAFFSFSFFPLAQKKYREWLLDGILVGILLIVVGGSSVTAMVDRAKTAPVFGAHDIILQQEAAMRYLITKKNPYKETYFNTPVAEFHYAEMGNDKAVNPALYHFVMPPWYLLFPFTFYYSVRPIVGFFDGRMALLFTMGLLLVALRFWFKKPAVGRLAIILTALSPSVIHYFIEGRSDVFAFSWMVVSLVLLDKKRPIASAAIMALAMLSKQTIWFIAPFYGVSLYRETRGQSGVFLRSVVVFTALFVGISLPFVLWDPKAFMDSVIFYLNGNSLHSYPVAGYGLSMVLYEAGIITDIHAYYPFILWQIGVAVPVGVYALWFFWRERTNDRLLFVYASFLLVFWYVSRYFNNSHLGYLTMVFALFGMKEIERRTL